MSNSKKPGNFCKDMRYWKLARPTAYRFPGRDEEHPINPKVLHAACRSAVKAAGLTNRVTLHSLRHSAA